jgi:FAD:protein FMN transferase
MSPDRFEAMGVDVLVGGATDAELEAVALLFEKLDRTFSRFRTDSELNRVNAVTAEFVAASPMFVRVLALALDAASRTDGLVDPTLGAAIEAAGYDRDFADVTDDERPPAVGIPGSWRHVRVAGPLVFRYPGTKLDLNCVVKGLAVDAALQQLAGDGFVAAGGAVTSPSAGLRSSASPAAARSRSGTGAWRPAARRTGSGAAVARPSTT